MTPESRTGEPVPNLPVAVPQKLKRVDTDFLPAALEALETPPSPIGRTIIWLIIVAVVAATTWGLVAQVDMVAVAEGRVIPRSRLQSVEAPEAGVIRAIHVTEGQRVTAGQPLLEFDPTYADADAASAGIEYATADLVRARAEALMRYATEGQIGFVPPKNADQAAAAAETEVVRARISALEAQLAALDQRIEGARAARNASDLERTKLEATLPLLEERHRIMERLGKEGLTPRVDMIEMETRLIELRGNIDILAADAVQASAEMSSLRRERTQVIEEFRGRAAAEKAEAEAIVATRAEGVRKARQREGYQSLASPVAGTINEITVTTIGEVAEAGSLLVTIVPEGDELIVEALALNRDVGFIGPGQEVVVKLDAYPFTRHGHVIGVVEHISADAIADEARGLVFPVRVRLVESRLREATFGLAQPTGGAMLATVGGNEMNATDCAPLTTEPPLASAAAGNESTPPPHRVSESASAPGCQQSPAAQLSPGMTAKVEVITGRRTVLDYILSPIARATAEAGRER